MLPISLGAEGWPVLVVGAGVALHQRLRLLREAGITAPRVHENDLPTEAAIAAVRLLFVAGLPREQSEPLAILARQHRVLVNVEDVADLCDFHIPALVRRGALSIAISTAGQSPALAVLLRRALAAQFDNSWISRMAIVAAARARLRAAGADGAAVLRETERLTAPWLTVPAPQDSR